MATYQKLPIQVEAFLFGVDPEPKWFREHREFWGTKISKSRVIVRSLEGDMEAWVGKDYIIKGIQGEIYPCKKEIFEKSYVLVE